MRIVLLSVVFVLSNVAFNFVVAAPQPSSIVSDSKANPVQKTEESKDQKNNKNAKKTTDVSFDDILVQGRYNFSDEAVTTVEEDKVLDALLGVRKDFDDRVKISRDEH